MITIDDAEYPDDIDIAQLNKRIEFVINFYKQKADGLVNLVNLLFKEINALKKDCSEAYNIIDHLTQRFNILDENRTWPLENLVAAQDGVERPFDISNYPISIPGTVSKL